MKVVDVDLVAHQIPFDQEFPVSYESHAQTEHLFVRIETDTIHTGWGEGTALPWFTGEVSEGLHRVATDFLVPQIVEETIEDALIAFDSIFDSFPNAAGAKAAIEMALLDLRAKQLNVPLFELFGHQIQDVFSVTHIIPAVNPAKASDHAKAAVEKGFESFKLKADGEIASDVARINSVLSTLPTGSLLRIDANTGWNRYERARRVVEKIDDRSQIEYIEQPVEKRRIEDMRRLWENTGIPVFADESVSHIDDVFSNSDNIAGFHLKLAKTGSLRRLADMQRAASHKGMTISVVSAFGTSLEATANLHLAAKADNLSAGIEICTGLLADDLATPRLPVSSEIKLTNEPGIGISLPDRIFSRG